MLLQQATRDSVVDSFINGDRWIDGLLRSPASRNSVSCGSMVWLLLGSSPVRQTGGLCHRDADTALAGKRSDRSCDVNRRTVPVLLVSVTLLLLENA